MITLGTGMNRFVAVENNPGSHWAFSVFDLLRGIPIRLTRTLAFAEVLANRAKLSGVALLINFPLTPDERQSLDHEEDAP